MVGPHPGYEQGTQTDRAGQRHRVRRAGESLQNPREGAGDWSDTASETPENQPPDVFGPSTPNVRENTSIRHPNRRLHGPGPRGNVRVLETWGEIDSDDLTITNGVLTFGEIPDFENPRDHGRNNDYRITVIATDRGSETAEGERDVIIQVTDVNERPVVGTVLSNTTLVVDDDPTEIPLLGTFSDPDGDTLYFAVTSSDTSVVSLGITDDDMLEMTPMSQGTSTITVSVADRETGGLTATQSFTATVTLATTLTISMNELEKGATETLTVSGENLQTNISYSLRLEVSDARKVTLSNSCSTALRVGTANWGQGSATRQATFQLMGCAPGEFQVEAELRSDGSTTATASETFTVVGPPDPPVITSAVPGDGQVVLNLSISDNTEVIETQMYDGVVGSYRTLPFYDYEVEVSETKNKVTITGLENGTIYLLEVRASNADYGPSPWSLDERVIVPLQPPTGLDLTPSQMRMAEVSWETGNNRPDTRYQVRVSPLGSTTPSTFSMMAPTTGTSVMINLGRHSPAQGRP